MNPKNRFAGWLDATLNVFLTPRCLGCQGPIASGYFCNICQHSIEHLSIDTPPGNSGFLLYQGSIREAIIKAKFGPNDAIAHQLIRYWQTYFAQETLAKWHSLFAGVSFIPLHWRRRFKRGYDFSSLFARSLANTLRIPCWDLLRCTRFDLPLSQSSHAEERAVKVENKYACRQTFKTQKPILLVDDILTTGATLEAGHRILSTHGFRVHTVAFAQTPLHNTSRHLLSRVKT